MAKQDIEEAKNLLAFADPSDTKTIVKLQNKAALGRMFVGYINELFTRGEEAIEVFKHEQTQDRGIN